MRAGRAAKDGGSCLVINRKMAQQPFPDNECQPMQAGSMKWKRFHLTELSTTQLALIVFLIGLILQFPLVFNPGYFSHDELQWAARADVATNQQIPWVPWLDIDMYQYRPLTFNMWLWLSHLFFKRPYTFHAILVVWGSINAALLVPLARYYGVRPLPSLLGALSFALGPYALYVHGWVATIADLIVLSCILLIALIISRTKQAITAVVAAGLFSLIGLLSKESAIAIPALLAVAWVFDGRKRTWMIATVFSGMVVSIYLGIRAQPLLHQPENTQYILSIWNLPLRWVEYQLYWIIPTLGEPHQTVVHGLDTSVVWAGLL
jgi:hypothetical protein